MKVSTYLTIGGAVVISILGGISGAAIFQQSQPEQVIHEHHTIPASQLASNIRPGIVSSTDFSSAAEQAVHAVVNVKTTVEKGYYFNPFKEFFFGSDEGSQIQPRIVQGSGSGVIIASSGYIVTNNHVIKDAVSVTVTLNDNREYVAEVVGIDATTDLAVLKISSEKTLPIMTFANSDNLRLGEWVLAVGNPFNLTSTVTAGIVSAKGRNINIIDNQSAIEAFIQTDAAVNPGNSGGALINTSGELIGINTAISTHTGSYEGYSFAIPANIVSKVVNDIMTYGVVRRAYLGVSITNINQALKEQKGIDLNQGVYIAELSPKGAAMDAGLKKGDIIVTAGGKIVKKTAELLEVIGSKKPGDKLLIEVIRNGNRKSFQLTLKNLAGTTEILQQEDMESLRTLGAAFETLTQTEMRTYGLRSGVKISDIGKGNLAKAGVPQGFILVRLNNQYVSNQAEVTAIINTLDPGDGLLLQGLMPNGQPEVFAFAL